MGWGGRVRGQVYRWGCWWAGCMIRQRTSYSRCWWFICLPEVTCLASLLVAGMFAGCAWTQCSEGRTYSNAIISPNLETSKIMPVPQTTPLGDCTSACCDLSTCDLAWWFEGRCYLVSCPHKESCEPKKMGSIRSYLTFVLRPAQRPAPLLDYGEVMLNRGAPSGIWGDSPEDIRKDLPFLGKDRGLDVSEYSDDYRELEQNLFQPDSKQEPRGSAKFTDWGLLPGGEGGFNSSAGDSPTAPTEKQPEDPGLHKLNESAWTPVPKPSPERLLLPLVTAPPPGEEVERETSQLHGQAGNSSGKEVGVAGVCVRREGLSSPWSQAQDAGGASLDQGRSPGEGNGHPLQYSCLENPLDRGAWQVTVHGVTKNQTRLSN